MQLDIASEELITKAKADTTAVINYITENNIVF